VEKMISAAGGKLEVDADLSPGGINGDVVSHCSTADCVDSSVSNVAKKPNQKAGAPSPNPTVVSQAGFSGRIVFDLNPQGFEEFHILVADLKLRIAGKSSDQ
jgi:hypothetical protein